MPFMALFHHGIAAFDDFRGALGHAPNPTTNRGFVQMAAFAIILAVILTAEQAFDCISTNLVISKGRGHEGNGLMAKWMGLAGQWWWIIKLPAVALIWWAVIAGGPFWVRIRYPFSDASFSFPLFTFGLALVVIGYGLVVRNNFKIAWRQA